MERKRLIFMDAKFTKLKNEKVEFLSVAFVTDSDSKLYLELEQPHMANGIGEREENIEVVETDLNGGSFLSKEQARDAILEFIDENYAKYEKPMLITNMSSYCWLALCHLFEKMEIPFHKIPLDFSTMLYMHSIDPDTSKEQLAWHYQIKLEGDRNHALYNATLLKRLYEKVILGW